MARYKIIISFNRFYVGRLDGACLFGPCVHADIVGGFRDNDVH
jgi:hypothetical protein